MIGPPKVGTTRRDRERPASDCKHRLRIFEARRADVTVREERTQGGWGADRWALGAVGTDDPATDGLLHVDDCLEVLAAVTGESKQTLVAALERARSTGGKVELSLKTRGGQGDD